MHEPTFEQLAVQVRQWASDRQILQHSTTKAQLAKLEEERQEGLDALEGLEKAAFDEDGVLWEQSQHDLKDAIGDMLVCVVNAAAIAGIDPVDALAHAYDQIKDRTGTLGADGIFYKDGTTPDSGLPS